MARSTYIYFVIHYEDVVAAFTVKHELVSYLAYQKAGKSTWAVYRTRDGGGNLPVNITDEVL